MEPYGTTQNHVELCGTNKTTPSITQPLFVSVLKSQAENMDAIKLAQSVEPTLPIDDLIMF